MELTHPSEWCKVGETWVGNGAQANGVEVEVLGFCSDDVGMLIQVSEKLPDGRFHRWDWRDFYFLRNFAPRHPHQWWARELLKFFSEEQKCALLDELREWAA